MRRLLRIARRIAVVFVFLVALVLVLAAVLLLTIETPWGKRQIRRFIVAQASDYLTAQLEIGEVTGSLVRNVGLKDIRLTKDGQAIVAIDEVSLRYSIRELLQPGVVVRSLRLVRPRVVAARQADGRWNLAALVKQQARDRRDRGRTGPARPLEISQVTVVDGDVALMDPLAFGAARVPARYERLNADFSFSYKPVTWTIDFRNVSWSGGASDLTVKQLTGQLSSGATAWGFDDLLVETPRSQYTLDGRVERGGKPAVLDLRVRADRFAFQEWSLVLSGLRNIAIESAFDVTLKGPLRQLVTDLDLRSNGGNIKGVLTLDTSVPGWRGKGAVDIAKLDLAPWFNRQDRASDITGRVRFDLALQLGRGIPRGIYEFDGSHARYLGYEGEDLHFRGAVTEAEWQIGRGTAVAYGADVAMESGRIGLKSPYPYRFQGTARAVDLRRLPDTVPIPHVESVLAFEFDANGQFVSPFLIGRAWFEASEFIGAAIGAGTVGSIDTTAMPISYSGEGEISQLNLNRYGEALKVAWMQDPRYAGTISGHFSVEGAGSDAATLTLSGGGRLTRAELFGGVLSDADVAVTMRDGSLTGSFDGDFSGIDPSVALNDRRYAATVSGSGRVQFDVDQLLVRPPALADYDIDADLSLMRSSIRDVALDRATLSGRLSAGVLDLASVSVSGPDFEGDGAGSVDFTSQQVPQFTYNIARVSPALLRGRVGQDFDGDLITRGSIEGPFSALRLLGEATMTQLAVSGLTALTTDAQYDVVTPWDDWAAATANVTARSSFVQLLGQSFTEAVWKADYGRDRLTFDVQLSDQEGLQGALGGVVQLHPGERALDLEALTVDLGQTRWRLVPDSPPSVLSWDEAGIAITRTAFVEADGGQQRIELSGTWRGDGAGALRVVASNVFLETLMGELESPARYGGVVNADATIRGTRERPIVTGNITVTEGRVYRLSYEKLAGSVGYEDGMLILDVRLDQAPGIWFTAAGTVPPTLFDRDAPEAPVKLTVRSSRVNLGLVQGITDAMRDVTGEIIANVDVIGTSRDPHFNGTVELVNAAFVVSATGASYRNGNALLNLASDRVTVAGLSLEDRNGRRLRMSGSLATHELRVGDVAIDVNASNFEVLRNEFGTMTVNADIDIRGQFERPRILGNVTILQGELRVDEILSRTLTQPYATQAIPAPQLDAIRALNPWERLSLEVNLHSQGALRLVGDSVLVTQNTPLGLGSFNIRASGDLFLTKVPGGETTVTGSLDSLTGRFEFQGRRFELYPSSSLDFRGDLNPDVFITVFREISGVETRVTISGPMRQPALQLSSNPPLDPSDVLSLIVFNTSTNELSAGQRQELAVRAGTLAVGFLANALTDALQRAAGIDILEIEPATGVGGGAKVTVGEEIAPGLVARFSRHFGADAYDEATIEYQLLRILRIRATFSDASSLSTRSPFRRIESAGIDLLFFFSF
jgi:hypothetical protein